jgi:hypothetical protein
MFFKELSNWIYFQIHQSLRIKKSISDPTIVEVCKKITDVGFVTIPQFVDSFEVKLLVEEGVEVLNKENAKLWRGHTQSDTRAFGIDRISKSFDSYFHQPYLRGIFNSYLNTDDVDLVGYSMFAKIIFRLGNMGSGEGWHRDSCADKQVKSILYLSDVNSENGPFQYIELSHRPLLMLLDWLRYGISPLRTRIDENKVNKLIQNEPWRLREIHGKAGDIILADTRGIHRGKPLNANERFAVTNYIWINKIPDHMEKVALKNLMSF